MKTAFYRIGPGARPFSGPVLCSLLVVTAVVIAVTLPGMQYANGADEGYYLKYALYIMNEGLAGFPDLFEDYLQDRAHWQYPNPLRVGYIWIAAQACRVTGASFFALSCLSLLSHLLLVALTFFSTRRWAGTTAALSTTALVAFSPLFLGLARRALLDSFATLTAGAAIWLFLETLVRPRDRRCGWLFGGAFLAALLAKETAILLLPALAAAAGVAKVRASVPTTRWRVLLPPLLVPPALAGVIFVLAAGGPANFMKLARIILMSPATNRYALAFGGGPWFRYLVDFLLCSPWVTLAAVAYAGFLLLSRKQHRVSVQEVCLGVIFVVLLAEYNFFTKNIRYAAVLNLVLCTYAALALCQLAATIRQHWKLRPSARTLALLATGICCIAGVLSFHHIFIRYGVYDPVTFQLMRAREMVPSPGRGPDAAP